MSFSKKMHELSYENNIKTIYVDKLPVTNQIIELPYYGGEGLKDLFYLMKEEKVKYAFYVTKTYEEVYQTLYFYDAIKYLEITHNIMLTKEYVLYDRLSSEIDLYNKNMKSYKSNELGYRSLTFIKNNIQYTVVHEELWYKQLMAAKQTIEEFVNEFVNRHAIVLEEKV